MTTGTDDDDAPWGDAAWPSRSDDTQQEAKMVLGYLIFVLVGGAVVVVGLAIMGALFRPHAAHPISPIDHARDILGERYLAGEINTQEYCRRRDALR
jgi:uncharacterized membrane protein